MLLILDIPRVAVTTDKSMWPQEQGRRILDVIPIQLFSALEENQSEAFEVD